MDIHKGRANANKLMNRLLFHASKSIDLKLSTIDGGSLRNAIPRESTSVVVVPQHQASAFQQFIADFATEINNEFK